MWQELLHAYASLHVVVCEKKQICEAGSGSKEVEGTVIQFYDWRERRGKCRGDYLPQVTLEICKYVLKLNQCATKLSSTLKWYLFCSLSRPAGLSKLDSRYKADCDRKGSRTFKPKKRVIGSPLKIPRATGLDWMLTQVAEADESISSSCSEIHS